MCEVFGTGLNIRINVLQTYSGSLPLSLAQKLHSFANEDAAFTAKELSELQRDFALFHVDSIQSTLDKWDLKSAKVDLISVHGQTVYHAPPYSWQLFAPSPLSLAFNVPVVCDLRAADLAAYGQGAPLTPLADYILFRDKNGVETRAILNLGGFCNITLLAPSASATLDQAAKSISGFDVCACSQLLDAVARLRLEMPYDREGLCAKAGTRDLSIVKELVLKLKGQAQAKRSLGTSDFPAQWIQHYSDIKPNDLAASAVSAVATVIIEALPDGTDSIFLAGGGRKNTALCETLTSLAAARGMRLTTLDGDQTKADIYADYREAISWAILGALSMDKIPITLTKSTGVEKPPVAGLWAMPPFP